MFLNITGFQHTCLYPFCSCQADSVMLLQHNLWPGSATLPKVAFHIDFMETVRVLSLEGHLSISAICRSVEEKYYQSSGYYPPVSPFSQNHYKFEDVEN